MFEARISILFNKDLLFAIACVLLFTISKHCSFSNIYNKNWSGKYVKKTTEYDGYSLLFLNTETSK